MMVYYSGSGLMGPRLTLLVARFQGTLPVYHLAPAFGLPATAKPLASFLLPIAIAIVLYHTFLSSSLIHRVAPHARRIRHHATPIAPYARQSSRAYQTRRQFSTSFRPILHGGVYDKIVRVAAASAACGACRWCSAVWKPSYRGSLFGRPIHWTNRWVGGRNVRIIA